MRFSQRTKWFLAFLASAGMQLPSLTLAKPPAPAAVPRIADVALGNGGTLTGVVVDATGKAVAGADLKIAHDSQVIVTTQTGKDGTFHINSLRGGVYECNVNQTPTRIRLWTEDTAPPSASNKATLTTKNVVRGQSCTADSCTGVGGCTCSDCAGGAPWAFLMNPIVIGAVVAAAVAIPLALDDDDDAS